ncbi:hypothetical protein [Streptomyces sp. NPDC059063]|uniref:hypothetical protein n=1 Tax=unclassified Streptomyces TaxID=2593676 RepID=UPI003691FD11
MVDSIRWTVLPDGVIEGDTVRVSVLVSPSLTGITTLGRSEYFPRWPEKLSQTLLPALRFEFDNPAHTFVTEHEPTDRYPAADIGLWRTLFNDDTLVTPPPTAAALAETEPPTLRSFPGKLVHDEVIDVYRAVAVYTTRSRVGGEWAREEGMLCEEPPTDHRGWELPPLYQMPDFITQQVLDIGKDIQVGFAKVEAALNPHSDGPRAADDHTPRYMDRYRGPYTEEDFKHMLPLAEAARFYEREQPSPALADEEEHRVDFHEACGLLGDYPELQRRFGLVVDLRFTLPAGVADGARIRVQFDPGLPGAATLNAPARCPWTQLRLTRGSVFEAAPATESLLTGRMLNLSDPKTWHLTELDVDGAALKHIDYARSIAVLHKRDLPASPGSVAYEVSGTGTPAARGAGITLLRTDRDKHLAHLIGADVGRQTTSTEMTLTADDLVRGYRVDIGTVDPATGAVVQWRSLLRRRGRYTIRWPGQPPYDIQVRPDEGMVRANAVAVTGPPDKRQLYGHQAVCGWQGWSLAAPRPGRTIGLAGEPEAPAPPISPDVPLETKFTAEPGSLPALRYGRTYRMRARVVDLAGNGLEHTATTPDAVRSEAITYGRWEPVPQPVVIPLLPFNEGESTERLVIRSTVTDDGRHISPDEYVLWRANVPDHKADSDVDHLDRQYKPTAERHVAPPKTALQMAEEHGVFDAAFGAGKPDRLREEYFAVASRESGSFLDTKVRDPEWPHLEHDLLLEGDIRIAKHDVHDAEPLTRLPLPRRGAGLKRGEFVVHRADQLLLPYLPDVLAEGVMLRGLPGDRENRKIPFPGPWPQAKPFKIRIKEGTGAPHWYDIGERVLEVYLPKGEIATVRLSCYLNAQKLPLLRQWNLLTASDYWKDLRPADKAFVTQATADGENWMLTPWVEVTLVHAVEKPVLPPELAELTAQRTAEQTAAEIGLQLTTHAESTGHVEVDARWSEWLDDVTQDAPTRIDGHTHLEDITLAYNEDVERTARTHEFGDTRHRNVRYTPTAVTRFREYFHPTITADRAKVTRLGATTAPLPVPSTRRPEPPVFAYAVPTMRRERSVDHERATVTQRRRTAGLRVYLNRPWFSSGDDEMLAVIIDPGTDLPDTLATRWGVDPVWADTTTLPRPAAEHFPNADKRVTGLHLAEFPDTAPVLVDAVAFTPQYHQERRLWYVDIDLDFGTATGPAYFPYLRLALARYQPYAIDPLHLSKVERAEFAQLVPPRTLTGRREGEQLTMRLAGPAPFNELGEISGTGVTAAAASRRVVVTLQSRAQLGEDDMDWKQVGTPVELTCRQDGTGFAWSGGIAPPTGQALTDYRLLVQEYELYRTDKDTATDTFTVNGTQVFAARRPVHADYFALAVGLLGRIDFKL